MKFLHLNFLPRSADVGLLLLRVWFGVSMVALHGWLKVANFSATAEKFPDILGLGSGKVNLGLATFGEFICASLVALGLFTRISALVCGITMFVAFWFAHGHRLTGQGNGEMAFLYLGAFLVLFVAGGGKYSVDAKLGVKA